MVKSCAGKNAHIYRFGFPTAHGIKKAVLVAIDKLLCHSATYINPEGFGVKNDLSDITSKPMHIIGHGNVRGIDLDYWKRDVYGIKSVVY